MAFPLACTRLTTARPAACASGGSGRTAVREAGQGAQRTWHSHTLSHLSLSRTGCIPQTRGGLLPGKRTGGYSTQTTCVSSSLPSLLCLTGGGTGELEEKERERDRLLVTISSLQRGIAQAQDGKALE